MSFSCMEVKHPLFTRWSIILVSRKKSGDNIKADLQNWKILKRYMNKLADLLFKKYNNHTIVLNWMRNR